MQNQLQKAIDLAKKTGDRLIVFDSPKADNVFVVMCLDEYEKLIIGKSEVRGLTEDELLDKINRDIAIWKSEQDFIETRDKSDSDFFANDKEDNDYMDGRKTSYEPSLSSKFATPVGEILAKKKKAFKNPWAIPTERKNGAEEIIEEDRQYLEEV